MLQSEEAARRLGVKLPTLYAYVSRGLLTSHPAGDGRRSLFSAEDVEALAKRSQGARNTETKLATVMTSVTQLRDEGPLYRGRPATELATSATYEEVAELLWGSGLTAEATWRPFSLRPPSSLGTADRLRWAVLMAGADDPVRADLRPEAVTGVARRLVATMVAVLPSEAKGCPWLRLPGGPQLKDTVAGRLAAKLIVSPRSAQVAAVNAALVLLADHELAASTLAVRVAASTRAHPYDAVLAGLSVVAGPLHGGASQLAYGLLREIDRLGPQRAVDEVLRWQGRLPGFGHSVYGGVDPRFCALRDLFDAAASSRWRQCLDSVVALATARGLPEPNVDLGLAALTLAMGMPEDGGRTIFTVARVAGWIAHYLEELSEPPVRYRARAVYAGRRDPVGL